MRQPAERMPTETLRIVQDPLGYYRPWRAARTRLTGPQRGALNRWLWQQHRLEPYSDVPLHQRDIGQQLLTGWARLPAAAYLMACAKHRSVLAGSPLYLQQPPVVHAFLRLRFSESAQPLALQHSDDLLCWGASYLLQGLQGQVPGWLQQRMALWFSGLPLPPLPADHFDLSCFWSAWHHASQLP